jgi:uncharacterized protein YdeI (YjbR/CyaY-like superfamily)
MKKIPSGTVHKLPADVRKALEGDRRALTAWESLTALSRNEWICWIISVKKAETRAEHISRACAELIAGERRPCCWMGCMHRTDKALSPSQKFILGKLKGK